MSMASKDLRQRHQPRPETSPQVPADKPLVKGPDQPPRNFPQTLFLFLAGPLDRTVGKFVRRLVPDVIVFVYQFC